MIMKELNVVAKNNFNPRKLYFEIKYDVKKNNEYRTLRLRDSQ